MHPISRALADQEIDEITYQYRHRRPVSQRRLVSSGAEANAVLRPLFGQHVETYEAFRILLLDGASRLKGAVTISTGGVAGTVADPKLIFGIACRTLACSLVLAHNHPSGQLRPSSADIEMTARLVQAGKLLDIAVVDHVILTRDGFFSMADHGLV